MKANLVTSLLALAVAAAANASSAREPGPPGKRDIAIPTIDLSQQTERQVVIAAGTEKIYQGHASTVLLPDGKTMFCTWTYGHGGACGPLKRSDDGGLSWSELLPVPENWSQVRNCPAIYRLADPQGRARLFTFAGQGPDGTMHQSRSDDGGRTWTPMQSTGLKTVMPLCTIEPVDGGKRLLGMTNIRRPGETEEDRSNVIAQSFSDDGGLSWSAWEVVLDVAGCKPCEPCLIRSPDGKELLCIMRENNRSFNSWTMTSDDEGRTWSDARQAPAALSGDRHDAAYAPDGRLLMAFRDTAEKSPTRGHFVGWVGSYEDLREGREGQYRVKLLHSYAGSDCGYAAVECLPDGTLLATTYVKYRPGPAKHSVVGVRLKLDKLDELEAAKSADRPAEGRRPNIILIMSDDMGYSDIGCYGGEIDTPVLNRLADGGLRFTQFYNTARCCPTRASLMTGLYMHQAGVGHMMNDRGQDGYRGDLNRRCATIAEVLRSAGYATYMAGKWHVTKHTSPEGPKFNWPLARGFDRFYGTIHGAGSFFDPSSLVRDNTMISPYADPEYRPETYYYTDAISAHAVRFIAEHKKRSGQKPFFVYVPFTAAHWPMHALPEDIAKYQGKYDAGYQAVREARFARMKEVGVIGPHQELSPQAEQWEAVPEAHRPWEARCMEVYAAMVDRMDQGIGRIVGELERQGVFDDTLILFLQDNGGCAEGMGRGGDGRRAERPTLPPMDPAALQTGSVPRQTRDGWPVLQGKGVMPGPADTYIGYGRGWANVSNTPFREYKHWVHEGGISTPLVAHWPAGIRRRGELEHQPGHLIDIMATCVDLAGAEYPKELGGVAIQPMEGVSLAPAFSGKPLGREGAVYWEHEGNRAVRLGNWKLVAKGRTGPWELYDIEADRSELNDLAAAQPERVKEMANLWQSWAERANILPWPGNNSPKPKANKKAR